VIKVLLRKIMPLKLKASREPPSISYLSGISMCKLQIWLHSQALGDLNPRIDHIVETYLHIVIVVMAVVLPEGSSEHAVLRSKELSHKPVNEIKRISVLLIKNELRRIDQVVKVQVEDIR
jgi:hypothetical protein